MAVYADHLYAEFLKNLMSLFFSDVQVTSVPLMRGWIPTQEIASNFFTTTLQNVCLHWNVVTKASITVVKNGANTLVYVSTRLKIGGFIIIADGIFGITDISISPFLLEEKTRRS